MRVRTLLTMIVLGMVMFVSCEENQPLPTKANPEKELIKSELQKKIKGQEMDYLRAPTYTNCVYETIPYEHDDGTISLRVARMCDKICYDGYYVPTWCGRVEVMP